jgi:hypothetical protein
MGDTVRYLTACLVVLVSLLTPSVAAAVAQPACAPREAGGPVWVTADCINAQYNRPVIDSQVDLTTPVPHRKVSAHFEGTPYRFNVYLPPKPKWDGRFFQSVYPLATFQDENATAEVLSFGSDSGAYTVQTNSTGGYRVDAAAAKFAKRVAASYYGEPTRRIYGYIWGGSGGSFQTIGAIENSTGVWDGAVPWIVGSPTAVPNNFFVRAFARLVLQKKAAQIADAVAPGGSGNPYAGLSEVEWSVLAEVTKMGVPLRAWEDPAYVLGLDTADGLLGFSSVVKGMDPTYVEDFWTKPGYLGTERSALGDLIRAAKIDHRATITDVERDSQNNPIKLLLDSVPTADSSVGFDYTLYDADGTTHVGALTGTLDRSTKVFTLAAGNPANVLDAIDSGDRLRIDNRWPLALTSYHRHQVPTRPGFYAWDQFRSADGTPIYPQRAIEVGPTISRTVSGGGTFSGHINGKVIVVSNLLDVDAYPWHADWYAKQVKQALGDRFDDNFRVWFNDNADHTGPRTPRLVDIGGSLEQALRDVSAWVEKGDAPPRASQYDVRDSQVGVPKSAVLRGGIQPVVDLTVDGADRIDVAAGKTVTFKATIQVPPGAGKVVDAEWDFAGSGNFTPAPIGPPRQTVSVKQTFTYTSPGVYFVGLQAICQRAGDISTPFARVRNLGRVRVVVH